VEFRRGLRLSLGACLAISIIGFVLDHAAWTGQQSVRGPFDAIDVASRTYGPSLGMGFPPGSELVSTTGARKREDSNGQLPLDFQRTLRMVQTLP
jgi:hypothetical protein